MKKTMKKYLAMLLAMVMVLCAGCAESNVQVLINEDGTCSVSVEELYEKESVDVIVNAVTNYMIMIYGAEEGAAHAEEITKVLEEYEQVNVDGKEYLKKVTEQTYQTCEEAIAYLEEQVGVGSVSLDTDHFYGAVNVNYAKESGLGSTGEALDTYEDMFLQMGLTREQVQEMIDNSITKISSQAFSGCMNLAQVTLPETLTEIEDCGFFCTDLTMEPIMKITINSKAKPAMITGR